MASMFDYPPTDSTGYPPAATPGYPPIAFDAPTHQPARPAKTAPRARGNRRGNVLDALAHAFGPFFRRRRPEAVTVADGLTAEEAKRGMACLELRAIQYEPGVYAIVVSTPDELDRGERFFAQKLAAMAE